MSSVVLDASAILCVIRRESGAETVVDHLPAALVSAVNLSEVFAKARDMQLTLDAVKWMMDGLKITVVPFDEELAYLAGSLREPTRAAGLSFGDRACLSLALQQHRPILTTDRAWSELNLGIEIQVIR